MYVKVKQLRENGRKKRQRDIAADLGRLGRLQAYVVQSFPVMHLYQWGPPAVQMPDVFFPLFQPQVINFRETGMMLRGWQRDAVDAEDSATCLQEWAVEFVHDDPPVVGGAGNGFG